MKRTWLYLTIAAGLFLATPAIAAQDRMIDLRDPAWELTGEGTRVQAFDGQVIAFLESLGRREFNHADVDEVDDEVTMVDFLVFASCFGSKLISPDDLCAIDDVDQDVDEMIAECVLSMKMVI